MPEVMGNRCVICGTVPSEQPMIYKGDLWCSDDCRKLVVGEISPTTYGILTGRVFNEVTGFYDLPLMTAKRNQAQLLDDERRSKSFSDLQ